MTSPSHGGDHAFESRRAHNLFFDTSFNYLRIVFIFEGAEKALATLGKKICVNKHVMRALKIPLI
jgi:hypothetical protein